MVTLNPIVLRYDIGSSKFKKKKKRKTKQQYKVGSYELMGFMYFSNINVLLFGNMIKI